MVLGVSLQKILLRFDSGRGLQERKERKMPVKKVPGGYKYGNTGKVYKSKAKAQKQGLAIRLSQLKRGKKVK